MICAVFILVSVAFPCARAEGAAPLAQLNDGRKMPVLALGTWLGNSTTGRIKPVRSEVEKAVRWAIEAGYRHIDTAWTYNVEDQVGRAINAMVGKWQRQQQLLTTTTPRVCNVSCYLSKLKVEGKLVRTDNAPLVPREEMFVTTKLWNTEHARKKVIPALKASLGQLQLSYVDLYLIHWPIGQFTNLTYDLTHYLETWRGMMKAKKKGLARSIGVSNFNQTMLEEIRTANLTIPAVLQIEWNLNLQQPELLSYCRQHNIAVMGYTPFGSMFKHHTRGAPSLRVNDPALTAIARKHKKNVPQIVLRYARQMGVVPIPKSLTQDRIRQNIDIFDFMLDDEDKQVLASFDRGYRTVPQLKWADHPYYPFERPNNTTSQTNTTTETSTTPPTSTTTQTSTTPTSTTTLTSTTTETNTRTETRTTTVHTSTSSLPTTTTTRQTSTQQSTQDTTSTSNKETTTIRMNTLPMGFLEEDYPY